MWSPSLQDPSEGEVLVQPQNQMRRRLEVLVRLQNLECRLSEQLCRSAENLVEPQNQGRRQLEVLVQPQSVKRIHERDEGWNEDVESLPAAYSF